MTWRAFALCLSRHIGRAHETRDFHPFPRLEMIYPHRRDAREKPGKCRQTLVVFRQVAEEFHPCHVILCLKTQTVLLIISCLVHRFASAILRGSISCFRSNLGL